MGIAALTAILARAWRAERLAIVRLWHDARAAREDQYPRCGLRRVWFCRPCGLFVGSTRPATGRAARAGFRAGAAPAEVGEAEEAEAAPTQTTTAGGRHASAPKAGLSCRGTSGWSSTRRPTLSSSSSYRCCRGPLRRRVDGERMDEDGPRHACCQMMTLSAWAVSQRV